MLRYRVSLPALEESVTVRTFPAVLLRCCRQFSRSADMASFLSFSGMRTLQSLFIWLTLLHLKHFPPNFFPFFSPCCIWSTSMGSGADSPSPGVGAEDKQSIVLIAVWSWCRRSR